MLHIPAFMKANLNEYLDLQVSVPTANMEEIIPAARLLSRATALTPSDYERAKSAFLSGMDASSPCCAGVPRQRTCILRPVVLWPL